MKIKPTVTRVRCTKCQGKGTTPLAPHLSLTLSVLCAWRNGISTIAMAMVLGIQPTAAINRLERLRTLGLATRAGKRNGRIYTAIRAK